MRGGDGWALPQLRRRIVAAAPAQDVNYRHAYHAGNFADVIKHVALTGILLHLKKKEKPFRVIDTHAGRGIYDLESEAAARTGEAANGIARLADLAVDAALPAALASYLDIVRRCGTGLYPGSPVIAAELLREGDRLFAIERHPDDAKVLGRTLARFKNAKAECADGYARLNALLPPPERRGLVVIDPPYEADDEFARVAAALASARQRFATGICLVWYPVKSAAASDALAGEVMAGGTQDVLRIIIDVGAGAANADGKERLASAGMLIVHPPYGFADEMQAAAAILAPRLGRSAAKAATIDVRQLNAGLQKHP
jgi:23S rRNA (adenine2030-N6)-methyltransferase